MTSNKLRAELKEAGAEYCKAEDSHGDTKTGWWLDGVYLGRTEQQAIEAIKG